MKTEIRNGKKIIVFDNVEEAKWHVHKKLCQNPCDPALQYIMKLFEGRVPTVAEMNKMLQWLPFIGEPCEVKT